MEHLEPKLYEWCLIEYRHVSKIVGRKNLMITNVKNKVVLKNITKNSFKESFRRLKLKRTCLMSQYAKKTLSKDDAKKFDYLVFGGILGDNPPKKRTVKYFNDVKCEKRNLGNKQMSTDTAVYVAKKIIEGKDIKDFDFVDTIDVKLDKYLSVVLPFRYARINEKVLLPKGLVSFLRKRNNI